MSLSQTVFQQVTRRCATRFNNIVSIIATVEEGITFDTRSMPGNPQDGHRLAEALDQVGIITIFRPVLAAVNRGYRGHGVTRSPVMMRKGVTLMQAKRPRRRCAI